jgi:hypothetical protein
MGLFAAQVRNGLEGTAPVECIQDNVANLSLALTRQGVNSTARHVLVNLIVLVRRGIQQTAGCKR